MAVTHHIPTSPVVVNDFLFSGYIYAPHIYSVMGIALYADYSAIRIFWKCENDVKRNMAKKSGFSGPNHFPINH